MACRGWVFQAGGPVGVSSTSGRNTYHVKLGQPRLAGPMRSRAGCGFVIHTPQSGDDRGTAGE
jgi:hypothetical protein